eukprot:1202756-Rhodomonas_salina.4
MVLRSEKAECLLARTKEVLDQVASPIALRACYAMSGTGVPYGASSYARATRSPVLTYRVLLPDGVRLLLRRRYAMSGTDIAYDRHPLGRLLLAYRNSLQHMPVSATTLATRRARMLLRARYARSGTELGYAATRSAVLG